MTQLTHWNSTWTMDPFDLVWKNFLDTNSSFSSITHKINYPVDIYETENGLRFELAVVGLEKDDLEILVEGNTLRITHDKKEEETTKNYIQRGITRRSFDLAWRISTNFDLSKLEAKMEKGLLVIDIPKDVAKAPKQVKIK